MTHDARRALVRVDFGLEGTLASYRETVKVALVHLDTSGLDSLRQLHKVVLLRGGTLRLENLQAQPREVIALAGFGEELARKEASREVPA